MLVFVLFFH